MRPRIVRQWSVNYKPFFSVTECFGYQGVYNRAPDYMREGGSIPVTLTFAEALGVNVLLLPMGRGDDGAQYVSNRTYYD